MFLARTVRDDHKGERGGAMLVAIGMTAVAGIIAITITSSSLYAVGYTTSTRSGVQAQAAAEAGIDFAAANLATAVCQAQYGPTLIEPKFIVGVSYSLLTASATGDNDTSWQSGCPTLAAKRVKLVSLGTATILGLAGNSSGDRRKVEAVYPYAPTQPGTGAAIYSFAQTDTTVNNLTIRATAGTPATMQYLSGSMNCTSGSVVEGSVILGLGGASLSSGCQINGDLFVSGSVDLQNSTVRGNVTADSGTYPSVSLSNSATVLGSLYAGGPVKMQGATGGDIIAGPGMGTSNISGTVGGSVIVSGNVNYTGPLRSPTNITVGQTGMIAPIIPVVPGWLDYPFAPADQTRWTNLGYTELALTDCSAVPFRAAMNTVLTSTAPRVLNALGCGAGGLDFSLLTSPSSRDITLKSNLVIVANAFKFSQNNLDSSDGTDKNLWLIIPDRGLGGNPLDPPNRAPDCPLGSVFKMTNNVTVGSHVNALIYSPCTITNAADVWQGQIYARGSQTANAFRLNYVPIGIPGYDFNTGLPIDPSAPTTGVLGARTALRNIGVV